MEKTKKTLIFMINGMYGGGAERVMSLLVNKSAQKGYDTYFVLANQRVQDAQKYDMDSKVHFMALDDVKAVKDVKINNMTQVHKKIALLLSRTAKS